MIKPRSRRSARRAESGHCIGEQHHRARHSDEDVRLVRALHAQDIGYKRIAAIMEIPRGTVISYCRGRVRMHES